MVCLPPNKSARTLHHDMRSGCSSGGSSIISTCPYSIRYPARCSIDCLLTSFTSLRNCSLDVSLFTHGRPLDLALMQNLHHLQCLSLRHGGFSQDDGICCNLNALQHLTKLVLFAATVSAAANCSFVGRLQSLDVESGRLVGLHSDGLAACKHLSHFCCRSGVIAAQADMDTLITNSSATHIPSSMSTLVELTHLLMQLNLSLFAPETEWDIGWLTHLTALRKLELSSDYPCGMPLSISRLTDLEDLTLAVDSELLIFSSQVDWPAMCKLTQLHLRGMSCSDGSRLHRLTEIRSLFEVHLAFFSITRYAARIGPKDLKVYRAMVKALREAFAINSPWIKLHCQCLTW